LQNILFSSLLLAIYEFLVEKQQILFLFVA